MSNVQNSPIERTEDESSVTIEQYGLRIDSGGPGRWRGGTGLVFTVRVDRDGCAILGRGLERMVFQPWGVAGGMPAACARAVLNLGRDDERELGKLDVLEVKKGDAVTIMTPGGGGFGDPCERPAELVLADVRRGFVSVEAAVRDYGVVIAGGRLDPDATQRVRASRRAAPRPAFDYGDQRTLWESVFDDELVTALNEHLLSLPIGARTRVRREIYHQTAPGLKNSASATLADAISDPAAQRALLVAAIERLKQSRIAA